VFTFAAFCQEIVLEKTQTHGLASRINVQRILPYIIGEVPHVCVCVFTIQPAISPSLSWNQHCNSSSGRLRQAAEASHICISPMLKWPT